MKKISKIGIISSIILIVYYLVLGLIDLFISNLELMHQLNETIFRVIFTLGLIGFYYSVSNYFERAENKSLLWYLYALILTSILLLGLKLTQYFIGVIPDLMTTLTSIMSLISVVLFVIFGINVLKIRNEIILNLKDFKSFIISMFVAFILILIATLGLTFTNRSELFHLSLIIYSVPYIFGLIFFLKLAKTN